MKKAIEILEYKILGLSEDDYRETISELREAIRVLEAAEKATQEATKQCLIATMQYIQENFTENEARVMGKPFEIIRVLLESLPDKEEK
jgi:hypothetical protein